MLMKNHKHSSGDSTAKIKYQKQVATIQYSDPASKIVRKYYCMSVRNYINWLTRGPRLVLPVFQHDFSQKVT